MNKQLSVELKEGDFKYPDKNTSIIPGGNLQSPKWHKYLNSWQIDLQRYLKIIKKFIQKNRLIGKTGEWQDDKYFKFSVMVK